jgi:hypothetical protein
MTRPLRTAMLCLTLFPLGCSDQPEPAAEQPVLSNPLDAAAWFRDDTTLSGINTHWASGADGRFLMPEIIGGGGALLDIDGDDDLDFYLIQGGQVDPEDNNTTVAENIMFRNDGHGIFTQVASGAEDIGYGMGVVTGDIDNDGDVDLYVLNVGVNQMYRNDGAGQFTNITETSGTGDAGWGSSGTFFDYDKDGDLDLYAANYLAWSPKTALDCLNTMGLADYCSPRNFMAPAVDRLYRNNGNGTFTDVSGPAGIVAVSGTSLGVVAADFDKDGWIDIFVANDGMRDYLWHNLGDGTFEEIALATGCSMDDEGIAKAGMGVDVADVDDDGDFDLFVCNLKGESDSLFRNDGAYFVDMTARSGLRAATKANTRFGVGLVDLNNDGWLDLYEANGAVLSQDEPLQEDPYAQRNVLLQGTPEGRWEPTAIRGGVINHGPYTSRAAIFGDIDEDGRVDILVVNRDAKVRVYRNTTRTSTLWITLDVRNEHGAPALGAIVTGQLGNRSLMRLVKSAWSYLAANDPRIHIGLGEAKLLKDVRVQWVDGTTTLYGDLKSDTRHRLIKPADGRSQQVR